MTIAALDGDGCAVHEELLLTVHPSPCKHSAFLGWEKFGELDVELLVGRIDTLTTVRAGALPGGDGLEGLAFIEAHTDLAAATVVITTNDVDSWVLVVRTAALDLLTGQLHFDGLTGFPCGNWFTFIGVELAQVTTARTHIPLLGREVCLAAAIGIVELDIGNFGVWVVVTTESWRVVEMHVSLSRTHEGHEGKKLGEHGVDVWRLLKVVCLKKVFFGSQGMATLISRDTKDGFWDSVVQAVPQCSLKESRQRQTKTNWA